MDLDALFWNDAVADAERQHAMRPCPVCKTVTKKKCLRTNGVHYGKVVCANCNFTFGWMPKPKNKDRRPAASLNLASKYGIEYCEMCLRHRDELPPPQTIFGHHVIEHQDGGTDERSNIWGLCEFCHEQVGLIRRRIGHNKLNKREGAA